MRRPLASSGLGLLLALGAVALRAEPITLAGAMQRARAEGRDARAAAAQAAAGAARVEQARAERYPLLTLQEIWQRTNSPADVFALQLQQERFAFPSFVASDPNQPAYMNNALTRVEASMPLYTGGQLSARIAQAELGAEAARQAQRGAADGAATAAAGAYLHLVLAREGVALLERSLATVSEHAKFAHAHVDQGMLVASEAMRADVEVARLRDLLSEAQAMADVAAADLSLRVNDAGGTPWEPAPLGEPPAPPPLDALLARVDQRPDLVAGKQMAAIAVRNEDVARAARKPRVGILGRYDLYDDTLFGTHGDNASVMVQAGIDLLAFGRHGAAITAARQDAEAAAQALALRNDAARIEARQAWVRARAAHERLATARQAVDAAREAERIVTERFHQGVVRMIDLLDAETARHDAENRELQARADAFEARLALARAVGETPEEALAVEETR